MRVWRPLYFEHLNSSVRQMLCVRWVLSTPFNDIISNRSTMTSSYLCLWPVGGCAMLLCLKLQWAHCFWVTRTSSVSWGTENFFLFSHPQLIRCKFPVTEVGSVWESSLRENQRNQMIGQKQSVLKTWLRKHLMLLENNGELRFCIFSGIWDRLKCLLWYLIK